VGGNGERGKLRGLHKELFDLIGGRAPIAETTSVVKAKVRKGPATKWDWRKFTNQARKDGLQLSHWVKADEPADKVYSFSKFNKLSRVPEYKRDDYLRLLADDNWSEEETTGLFELCRQFDLRFIVVHDHFKRRFPAGTGTPAYPARTVENLKARYYTVWTKLSKARNEVRKVRTTGVDVTYRYDAQHETMRKEQLTVLMGRTIAQIHEETQLRNDMKKIKAQEAQREKMTAPKREASDDGRNPKKKKKKDGTEPARGAAAPREVSAVAPPFFPLHPFFVSARHSAPPPSSPSLPFLHCFCASFATFILRGLDVASKLQCRTCASYVCLVMFECSFFHLPVFLLLPCAWCMHVLPLFL
jgi:hypothetical protein